MRFLLHIVLFFPLLVVAQVGGAFSYQTLNITSNARAAALGGTSVSIADGSLSQVLENPAVLDSVKAKTLFLNVNPYFADVSAYTMAYAFEGKKIGAWSMGLQYLHFGSFQMTDDTGAELGDFQVSDFVAFIGKSHRLGPFVLGLNLKLAHSAIESYGSTAILADLGGVFHIHKNWTIGLVMENAGGVVSDYTATSDAHAPFDVKLGTTFKPEYMPLRFTVTSTSLVEKNAVSSEEDAPSNSGVDNALKRVNVGAELLLSENFQVVFGYSHKRKQDLKLTSQGSGAGFSYGFMLKVKHLQFRFSRATYHAAGGTSFISMQTNLNEFRKIL